jgi:hypothetical protein
MTKHEMDRIVAQYRHWIDRPHEDEPPAPSAPRWRLAGVFGMAIALVLAGVGAAAALLV